jgi:hypothetical protein
MMTPVYSEFERELLGRGGAAGGLRQIWNGGAVVRQVVGDTARKLSELLRQAQ